MATKDDSVALWLHNKLGSTTHLWSFSSTVVSQYTLEKLHSIRDCFCTLDSLVKLKFLLSVFYIPKRCIDEFKPIIEEIIDNTIQTCLDQWVLSVAMFVKTFWLSQSLDTQFDYDLESFREAVVDLKQILRECIETESGCERSRFLLPIEFDYLSREARSNILPNTSEFTNEFLFSLTADENEMFTKHFKLFKSPKAVCKLDEMKTKASHYSKSKTTKSIIHTGLNAYAEYNEGINSNNSSQRAGANISDPYSSKIYNSNSSNPNSSYTNKLQSSSSFFKRSMLTSTASTTITGKSSTPKRNVGIKLLEPQEQSVTPKEAKRKRKEQEKESLKKQKQEQERIEKDGLMDQSLGAKQESHLLHRSDDQNNGIGLVKSAYLPEEAVLFSKNHESIENQSIIKQNESCPSIKDLPQFHAPDLVKSENQNPATNFNNPTSNQLSLQAQNQAVASISDILFQPPGRSQQDSLNNQVPASNFFLNRNHNNSGSSGNISNNNALPNFITNQFDIKKLPVQQQDTEDHSSPNKLEAFTTQGMVGGSIVPPMFTKPSALSFMAPSNLINNDNNNNIKREMDQQQQRFMSQQQTDIENQHRQQQIQQQQSLSLTREQMVQAQEMFSNSNSLSRPDKAQILGFIAGSRENPRPEQGNLIAIKLNEAEELILDASGHQQKVIAELYFEMNYDTGVYKKVKRLNNPDMI